MQEKIKQLHQQQLEDVRILQSLIVAGVASPNLNQRKQLLEDIICREKEISQLQHNHVYNTNISSQAEALLKKIERFTASSQAQQSFKHIKQNLKKFLES